MRARDLLRPPSTFHARHRAASERGGERAAIAAPITKKSDVSVRWRRKQGETRTGRGNPERALAQRGSGVVRQPDIGTGVSDLLVHGIIIMQAELHLFLFAKLV